MKCAPWLILLCSLSCLSCMGVARARSGTTDIPCDQEEITLSDRRFIGPNREQWTASCPAGEFICNGEAHFSDVSDQRVIPRSVEVSCEPSEATERRRQREEKERIESGRGPRKMAGFAFGSTVSEAAEACTRAGQKWTYQVQAGSCSGPAEDVGGSASVEVLFCEQKLCGIALVIPLVAESTWETEFGKVRGALHHNYGPTTNATTDYPPDCENRLVHCALEKRIKYRDYWLKDDFRITLEVRQPPGRRAIVIRYR